MAHPRPRQAFEAPVLPRIHLALRQFVRPIGPANQGSSSLTQEKPLVHAPEPKAQDPSALPSEGEKNTPPSEEDPIEDETGTLVEGGEAPSALPQGQSEQRDANPQKSKAALWNPNELLQLIKRIVMTETINKKQKGRAEYQNVGRRSQKGLALRKGSVLDKKAA